jgi:hypothetical protein
LAVQSVAGKPRGSRLDVDKTRLAFGQSQLTVRSSRTRGVPCCVEIRQLRDAIYLIAQRVNRRLPKVPSRS